MTDTLHRKPRKTRKPPRNIGVALTIVFALAIIAGVVFVVIRSFPGGGDTIPETPSPPPPPPNETTAAVSSEYNETTIRSEPYPEATESDLDSALYRALARLGAPKSKLRIRTGEKLSGIGGNVIEITANISKAFPMAMANHTVQWAWREAGGDIVDAVETRYGREVQISAGIGDIVMRKVTVRRELSDKPLTGTVALIIDDFGDIELDAVKGFLDLPIPFTASVIPFEKHTESSADALSEKGIEVIVHMPMEPQSYPKDDPGPKAIYVKLPSSEIQKRVREAIAQIPTAVGMNNHMGSEATSNLSTMELVANALKDSGLFFIDSRTTPYTCAMKVMGEHGIPTTCQNGNIDVVDDTSAIARRFIELALASRESEDGVLIVGHARPNTLIAIKRVLPDLEKWGIEFITASELVARRQEKENG
ncbi:MAG: divergent polysaccharide deacetylase family protein [bacterium]